MRRLTRRQKKDAVGFLLVGLMALGGVGYTAGLGLPAAGISGEESRVRVLHCETKGGGRGGTYTECAAERIGDGGAGASSGAVKVRYEGAIGDVIAVRTTPWGSHVAVRSDLLGQAASLAVPLFMLMLAAGCGGGVVWALRRDPAE